MAPIKGKIISWLIGSCSGTNLYNPSVCSMKKSHPFAGSRSWAQLNDVNSMGESICPICKRYKEVAIELLYWDSLFWPSNTYHNLWKSSSKVSTLNSFRGERGRAHWIGVKGGLQNWDLLLKISDEKNNSNFEFLQKYAPLIITGVGNFQFCCSKSNA